jgi:hypothetical protein
MLSQTFPPPEAAIPADAPGLTAEDRRHLLAWTNAARESGIDVTEDLGLRPWPVPVTAAVIGVFRTREDFASWLVVGQCGLWTVVSVADSAILATSQTLVDALTAIHPMRRSGGVPGAH